MNTKFKSLNVAAYVMLAVVLVAGLFSCETEEGEAPAGQETGFLAVSLDVFDVERLSNPGARVAFAPSLVLEDFGMIIYQQGTSNIIQQFGIGMIPTGAIELMEGDYTAVLDNEQDASITIGHYVGSQDFTILPQQQTDVDVTVTLQEVYFTFTLLPNFYVTHRIEVASPAGPVVVADAANPYEELYLPTLASAESYVFSVVNNTTNTVIGSKGIVSDVPAEGYNLTVNQLSGDGVFTVTIDPINVTDEEFELAPTEIVGFTDDFAGANWVSTNNGSATGYSFSSTTLSYDCPSGGGGFVSEITIPADGTISFDWNLVIRSAGQYGDRFTYTINGVATNLTTSGGGSGSESGIAVSQGDVFSFSSWGTTQSSSYYGSVQNFVFEY